MLLNPEILALSLDEVGIAVGGRFIQLRTLIRDFRRMLYRATQRAEVSRKFVEDGVPELEALIIKGKEYKKEKLWTVGEVQHLASVGDDKGKALMAPFIKMMLGAQAQMESATATFFPQMVWASVVVMTLAQWELSLRTYSEYLSVHLGSDSLDVLFGNETYRKDMFVQFKEFIKQSSHLQYDFGSSKEWEEMQKHQAVRNLIVHWGGSLVGPDAAIVQEFIERKRPGLDMKANVINCTDQYAEQVVDTAIGFVISFDESVRDQLPHFC